MRVYTRTDDNIIINPLIKLFVKLFDKLFNISCGFIRSSYSNRKIYVNNIIMLGGGGEGDVHFCRFFFFFYARYQLTKTPVVAGAVQIFYTKTCVRFTPRTYYYYYYYADYCIDEPHISTKQGKS